MSAAENHLKIKLVLPVNWGNESIALIQWIVEHDFLDAKIIYIETGWAAPEWSQRVNRCVEWIRSLGLEFVLLAPKQSFDEMIRMRGHFPTQQFQWCASFLKGLPLLEWLDSVDPKALATVVIANRRALSRARFDLPEWVEQSEHYGDRRLWHPLYRHSTEERDHLLKRAGFKVLAHRSLECDPCIHASRSEFNRLHPSVVLRTTALEHEIKERFLQDQCYQGAVDLKTAVEKTIAEPVLEKSHEALDMGCGTVYGCGL